MKNRHVYIINQVTSTKYQLCRVLNEYDSDPAVQDDLIKLLVSEITEKDLLKTLDKK
ncbi:MAG: hypothetical protein ACREV6_15135 [Clostridium sp.]|uniref:hypothetical protein n=1 Tax=Clostridium sp. TaxID=1506 RepID=UPI003D6D7F6F